MYKRNIGGKEFILFPNLSMEQKNDEDLITYCQYLEYIPISTKDLKIFLKWTYPHGFKIHFQILKR